MDLKSSPPRNQNIARPYQKFACAGIWGMREIHPRTSYSFVHEVSSCYVLFTVVFQKFHGSYVCFTGKQFAVYQYLVSRLLTWGLEQLWFRTCWMNADRAPTNELEALVAEMDEHFERGSRLIQQRSMWQPSSNANRISNFYFRLIVALLSNPQDSKSVIDTSGRAPLCRFPSIEPETRFECNRLKKYSVQVHYEKQWSVGQHLTNLICTFVQFAKSVKIVQTSWSHLDTSHCSWHVPKQLLVVNMLSNE